MPTLMNVNEAKANFSSVLANVENNLATVMIVRLCDKIWHEGF